MAEEKKKINIVCKDCRKKCKQTADVKVQYCPLRIPRESKGGIF